MNKEFKKAFGLKAFGAEVTPEMLGKINSFALKKLTAEDVYVRKYLLAHNAIDRDNERFPEALLDDYAATLPGKGFLIGHKRPDPGKGLFFDAKTEEMTPEAFKSMTGEEARLPKGITKVKVLWGWMYAVKAPFNEELMHNIDAGIYRHASIGYRATDLNAVKDDVNGSTLYWEYVPPGEATEGSIVWLGAQPGATSQKALSNKEDKTEKEAEETMKEFLKAVGTALGKTFTSQEDVIAEVESMKATISERDTSIKELEPLAAEGKAYREGLGKEYVSLKAKLGEVEETEEAQGKVKEVAAGYPIDFLKSEVESLKARVKEKFPNEPQIDGGDPDGQRDKSAGGAGKLVEDATKRAEAQKK
jgi:hypothetical protein